MAIGEGVKGILMAVSSGISFLLLGLIHFCRLFSGKGLGFGIFPLFRKDDSHMFSNTEDDDDSNDDDRPRDIPSLAHMTETIYTVLIVVIISALVIVVLMVLDNMLGWCLERKHGRTSKARLEYYEYISELKQSKRA